MVACQAVQTGQPCLTYTLSFDIHGADHETFPMYTESCNANNRSGLFDMLICKERIISCPHVYRLKQCQLHQHYCEMAGHAVDMTHVIVLPCIDWKGFWYCGSGILHHLKAKLSQKLACRADSASQCFAMHKCMPTPVIANHTQKHQVKQSLPENTSLGVTPVEAQHTAHFPIVSVYQCCLSRLYPSVCQFCVCSV